MRGQKHTVLCMRGQKHKNLGRFSSIADRGTRYSVLCRVFFPPTLEDNRNKDQTRDPRYAKYVFASLCQGNKDQNQGPRYAKYVFASFCHGNKDQTRDPRYAKYVLAICVRVQTPRPLTYTPPPPLTPLPHLLFCFCWPSDGNNYVNIDC